MNTSIETKHLNRLYGLLLGLLLFINVTVMAANVENTIVSFLMTLSFAIIIGWLISLEWDNRGK